MPSFSLLTVNTFGVPFFLSGGRLVQLANEVSRLAPDVVCLQEIQQNAYIPLMKRSLKGYPQVLFEWNGLAPKGGLMTACSADYTVVKHEFLPFPNRGKWLSIGFSDWALNKGVLALYLAVQDYQVIVLNTHLHANYAGNWQPENSMAQIQKDQVNYLAEVVRAQPEDALVIVCGDFNFPRHTFLYDELLGHSGLSDLLVNDLRPTYRPFPLVPSRWAISLDFIFYRAPSWKEFMLLGDILPIENAAARLPFRRFLTDHCALTFNANWRD